MEGQIDTECYKCFSIGPHRCYQKYSADREFVCETCGNLKSPFQIIKDQNNQTIIYCLWFNNTLTIKDLAQFGHILWCTERKVQTFSDFFKYHCICAEVATQKKWLLLK